MKPSSPLAYSNRPSIHTILTYSGVLIVIERSVVALSSMKIPFVTGLLVRFLGLISLSCLGACSSVLQATRISKLGPLAPAETGTGVDSESVHEKVFVTNDARRMNTESIYGLPLPTLGYPWLFVLKEGAKMGASSGYWQIKPIN